MPRLENRVAKLEAQVLNVNLSELSDEELKTHIGNLPFKSPEGYRATIALVMRHTSALPVIYDDPDRITRGTPSTSGSNMKEAQHADLT